MIIRASHRWLSLSILLVVLAGAACAPDRSSRSEGVSGEIAISGSSTVEPISALVAEKYRSAHPDVSVSVAGPGTTDGFSLFCKGEVAIADASRRIEPEEEESCAQGGVQFVELRIAIDGLTIITSPDNSAVSCLDLLDLYALTGPESEGFERWSDADALAKKLGAGHAPYPDAPLVLTGPGEESGTWGSFVELVLKDIGEDRGFDEVATRPDYQSSPNDNVIVEGVANSPTSLGWVGLAFFEQNVDTIKAIEVDGGDGDCVAPTAEAISDGSYPLARDLYIYVNTGLDDAVLDDFVTFYLSEEGMASIPEVGYVALPPDEIAATVEAWDARQLGAATGE